MTDFYILKPRLLSKDFFKKFICFFIYFNLVLFFYNTYLVDLYEYRGAGIVKLDVYKVILIFFSSLVSSYVCSSELKSPGDIFLAIYTVTVAPVAIVLSSASIYKVETNGFYIFVVLFSLVLLASVNKIKLRKSTHEYIINHGLINVLLLINLMAIFIVLLYTRDFFSFDYETYPKRRQSAKLVFSSGALRSYFISIFIQAVYPLLIMLACITKKKRYVIFLLLNVATLWGGFGEKYPVIVSLFVSFCFYIYAKKENLLLIYLLLPFFGLMFIGGLEYQLTGYSYINDYILRRVYAVPSVLNDAVHLYSERFDVSYYCDSLIGRLYCLEKSQSVTYLLSDKILNLKEMNANVNFMAMAFLRMKYIGVFFEVSVLMFFIFLLNYFYFKRKNMIMVSVGLLLGIRLIEQSLLTSLVSSGIVFLYFFALVSTKKLKEKY